MGDTKKDEVFAYDETGSFGLADTSIGWWLYKVDINNDKDPELFVGAKSTRGTGGGIYHIFQKSKDGYKHLGEVNVHPRSLEVTGPGHNGYRDLKGYWPSTAISLFCTNPKP